ncbi:four-helix bundle copper-binding protein [Pleurocapsales cyanobacterium LEGE 06147]|nr:four-helix bundle copper-binding protein [Pleurocapsales cyanobacterium LEGE 06147]
MLLVHQEYQSSFDVAMYCAVECEHCAEACIGNPEMVECARTCLDCAEICRTAATYMVRGSRFIPHLVSACAEICQACAQECEQYNVEHCQKCAKACHEAVEAYRKIATVVSSR